MSNKKLIIIGLFIVIIVIALVSTVLFVSKTNKFYIEVNSNYDFYTLLNDEKISNIQILNNEIKNNEIGTYNVELKISYISGKQVNKKLIVDVKDTTPPTFEMNENIELYVGEDFNPKDNIKVIDNYDGDISDKTNILSNTVDTKLEGEYNVIYSAVDSNGNQSKLTCKVKVLDRKYIGINSSIDYLKQNLKNPSSLQIKEVRYVDMSKIADYVVIVITYSAENGFGGMTVDSCCINFYPNNKKTEFNSLGASFYGGENISLDDINKHLNTNY